MVFYRVDSMRSGLSALVADDDERSAIFIFGYLGCKMPFMLVGSTPGRVGVGSCTITQIEICSHEVRLA